MGPSCKERLILFTRYPEAGRTKTRLIPVLGPKGAAELQRRMTERVLDYGVKLSSRRQMDFEVRYEGGSREMMRSWLGAAIFLVAQESGPLDRRMRLAFEGAFADGCRSVVIIGSDIPDITDGIVEDAFERLRENDLVLGPATDGGYYLIGLRHSSLNRCRCLLSDTIPWGTRKVFSTTLAVADRAGLSHSLLATLSDIDRPADLPVWGKAVRGKSHGRPRRRISVVIPALNEIAHIEATLASLQDARNVEVILVDGGSRDGTPEAARRLGADVLRANRGRAVQMNTGAAVAAGEILLFLHADTRLPPGFENHVRRILGTAGVSAGAFALHIDSPQPSLRTMEWGANLRSRYAQMPFGDQGIFLRASLFWTIGGFADLPIMEDVELIRRLKKKGRIKTASVSARTSARRWLSVGTWKTWCVNQMMMAGYFLGLSPQYLATFYRRQRRIG